MYITVKSIKRDLGFKGIEVSDIVIGLPMILLFIILFCFTPLKISVIVSLNNFTYLRIYLCNIHLH